ncbi:MAG: hypothetical protein KDD55_10480 [Bdellovibrionales bacterium]|nr:hypothetical protein [Bdellovibrionales bacterium]
MTYKNFILSLFSISLFVSPIACIAGEQQIIELSCGISVTPTEIECGQGVATLQLDATTTVCSDGFGTPSEVLCPDLNLTWRTWAPGPDGGLPILEYQGEPQAALTIATQVNGVSIEHAIVRLIAVALSHNLKVECDVPITIGQCYYDCNGDLGGNAVYDECGVCDGDGTSCMDCAGDINGTAEIDECGVCGGDNSTCTDCAGIINGTTEYDECGVCGGNGSSCIECESVDITSQQFQLDGVTQHLKELSNQLVKVLRRASGKSAGFSQYIIEANEAASLGWSSIWSLEQIQQSNCSNMILCSESNNVPTIENYKGALDTLKGNIDVLAKKLRRKYHRKRKARKIRKEATAQYELGLQEAEQLPTTQQSCDLT